jgi:hypothetical protein
MTIRLPNLIPPFRFTIVEENLFRGGYPKPRNKRFLKRFVHMEKNKLNRSQDTNFLLY